MHTTYNFGNEEHLYKSSHSEWAEDNKQIAENGRLKVRVETDRRNTFPHYASYQKFVRSKKQDTLAEELCKT